MPRLLRNVVTALLPLALSACSLPGFATVDADPPGVTVKALTTNVVFGAAPTPSPAPSPPAAPTGRIPELTPAPFDNVGDVPLFEPSAPLAAPPACPVAGPADFPAEPAGLDVARTPRPGRYLWSQAGKVAIAGVIEVPLSGFTSRVLTPPQAATDGSFTYQVEQVTLLGRQIETIRVVPGDGIFLTRLQYVGRHALDFAPVLPVEMVPLPIEQGVPYFSVGVDPLTLRTLRIDGTVTQRQRVDACGTVVDAWYVDGTRQFQTSDGAQTISQHDFAIAPQLGGLVVLEDVVVNGTTNDGLAYSIDATYTIGTLQPAPAPAAQPTPQPSPQAAPRPQAAPQARP